MPDEADGVYIDDLGTVGTTDAPHHGSVLSIGDLLATIARNRGTAAPQPSGADTRTAPVPGGTLYENVDHPTLKAMVTEEVDPDQVGALASAWQSTGARLTQFQDDVAGAINTSRGEWQGDAGDAARQFIADVGSWIGDAGRGAELASSQTAKQSEALAAARNAMPEPVPFDVDAANAELRRITDPVQLITRYAEHMQAYAAQQDAQRRAAQVVTSYDAALADTATMPAFAPPPAMAGDAAAAPPAMMQATRQPTNLPPLPRTAHESPVAQGGPVGGTSAQSASSSAGPAGPIGRLPESTAPQGVSDDSGQQQTAVPMTGGFAAVNGIDTGSRGGAPVLPAVPGGMAAANAEYLVDGDADRPAGTPPVIGG
jgi:hypothetical protein